MTEFFRRPYERVHVRDVIRLDLDGFIAMMSVMEGATAHWADGVLFASFAMTDSEELAKKEMAGEMYLDRVVFAARRDYTRTVRSSTNLEIGVLDVGSSEVYRQLVAWLKEQPEWAG